MTIDYDTLRHFAESWGLRLLRRDLHWHCRSTRCWPSHQAAASTKPRAFRFRGLIDERRIA